MKPDKALLKKRGDRLRQARDAIGLSIEEASAAFGAAYSTYAAHENGTTPYPLNSAIDYAKKYRVTLDWLVHGIGDGPAIKGRKAETPEAALERSLLAYGVPQSQISLAVSVIERFVATAVEGRSERSPSDDQSQLANPHRAK